MYPAPGVIERVGPEWDWLWLDGQHGQIAGYDTMLAMVRACNLIRRPAYVRVAGHEPGPIGLALDMGADAIIVPQVDSADQARALVRAIRFPPLGDRSFGGRRVIDLHTRKYSEDANTTVQLVCQIESPEALERAEEIASEPGVSALFLGPDDLILRTPYAMGSPTALHFLKDAIHQIGHLCTRLGKSSICVAGSPEVYSHCKDAGITHIVLGSDAGFLAEASRRALASVASLAAGLGHSVVNGSY